MLKPLIILLITLIALAYSWSPYHESHMIEGRSVIVQLHEWRFDDLAIECERFFGPKGYGAVQISPVNEHAIFYRPPDKQWLTRPWWERYQPVSYKIQTRSGNADQMRDMVQRCNKAGVRIYVDIVLNHMTANIGNGKGTAGSDYESGNKQYHGVPFSREHFNGPEQCGGNGVRDWGNARQVRNCELMGLHDLNQGIPHVRQKMIENLNQMLDMGVAGFRVDAAKHMWPADLRAIFDGTRNLPESTFGQNKRLFAYHEVIGPSGQITSQEYTNSVGRICEFSYMFKLQDVFRKSGGRLRDLQNFGHAWGFVQDNDAVTFIDNHDVQRGHTGAFEKRITYRHSRLLKMSTAFMLSWPYGITAIMSSYYWPEFVTNDGRKDNNDWIGPPHDGNYNILRVNNDPEQDCGRDKWVCEHRWRQIYNMVEFRNVASNQPVVNWWSNGDHQIAFSRRGKAFIAINNENFALKATIQTALPSGTYCDVISGALKGNLTLHCFCS